MPYTVLRKKANLDINRLSKATKTKLRQHFNVKVRAESALKQLAARYNRDVIGPRNERIKEMQGIIRDTKKYYRSKSTQTKTYDLGDFDAELASAFVGALQGVKPVDNRRPLITFNGKTYTLSERTAKSIVAFLTGALTGDETESDAIITQHIIEAGTFEISKSEPKKGVEGAFFPSYHNLVDFNLSSLQIYGSKAEARYNNNCFDHALQESGKVDPVVMLNIRLEMQTRELPQKKIEEIARKNNLHITIRRPNYTLLKHYGDKSLPQIQLGLVDEHYFIIKEMPITAFAIKHYHEVKNETEWWRIKQVSQGKYKRSNTRFISSYDVVKLLKECDLLRDIPVNDVLESPYFERVKTITTLDYTKQQIQLFKYVPKKRKGTNKYSIDFETTTDGDKHVPYLAWFVNNGRRKEFRGEDCGLQMLAYLSQVHYPKNGEKPDVINLMAHNMRYDLCVGLFEYLTNISMIGPKGTVLHAKGDFKYRGVTFKFAIQDTYAHIPERLAGFGAMFGLDVAKEIMPYDLYTRENVKRQYIPVEECVAWCDYQFKKNNIGKDIDAEEQKDFANLFLANCKKWRCVTPNNTVDIIEYSSRYCEMDCVVLEKGYNQFREWLLKITGLDLDCYVSLSSMVQSYYESQGVYEDVYMLAGNVREFIQMCMVGGRTMLSENKKSRFGYDGDNNFLSDFDAVSLYPSAMSRLGGYLKGKPKVLQNLTYKFLKKQAGYFVEILVKSVGTQRKLPLMSAVNADGVRIFTNDMVGEHVHVDKASLEDIIEFQDVEFEVIRGYYFDEGRNTTLKRCIDQLFAERVKNKKAGNPIEKVFKLMMNASYGKTLLKPICEENKYVKACDLATYTARNYNQIKYIVKLNEKASMVKMVKPTMSHFNYAQCGVEVLSMSKRIMNEVMCLAEDNGRHIYYQDTDSMHIAEDDVEPLAAAFKQKYGRDLIGKGMGQFHGDFDSKIIKSSPHARKSIFLGKKCYIDELVGVGADGKEAIDYHIRLKGVPNASILHLAQQEGCTVMQIFEDLFNGKEKTFDLLCGGLKVSFAFNNTMTVSSRRKFDRRIRFK